MTQLDPVAPRDTRAGGRAFSRDLSGEVVELLSRTASGGRYVQVDSVVGGMVNYSYGLNLGSEGSCPVSSVRRVVPPGEPVCL